MPGAEPALPLCGGEVVAYRGLCVCVSLLPRALIVSTCRQKRSVKFQRQVWSLEYRHGTSAREQNESTMHLRKPKGCEGLDTRGSKANFS